MSDQVKDKVNKIIDIYNKGVANVKAHPFRNIFIGIVIGIILSGSTFVKFWLDSERASSAIIGQLRSEQQRSSDLNGAISSGIADAIGKLGKAQGLAEKNSILFGELRKIVESLPDGK